MNYLQDKLGAENVVINDYWEADICAIGITNKSNIGLVYICTYMKKPDEYFVELESGADDKMQNAGSFDNITAEQTEEIVRKHLGI